MKTWSANKISVKVSKIWKIWKIWKGTFSCKKITTFANQSYLTELAALLYRDHCAENLENLNLLIAQKLLGINLQSKKL